MDEQALTAKDAAALLHLGRNTVYALAKSGELPSYRMGRKLLFSLDDVEQYRQRQRRDCKEDAEPWQPSTVDASKVQQGSGAISSSLASLPTRHLASPPLGSLATRTSNGPFVLAGQGLASDLIADRLEQKGHRSGRLALESYAALVALYEGSADAALVHLYDQRTNSYNVPYVQRLAPGVPVVVIRLISRRQGFAVAKSNPQGISSWGALLRPGLRLANRPLGCSARVLLDEKLLALEAHLKSIEGYDRTFPSGLIAVQAVADGRADVAVADESLIAQVDGVDFVPLQREWLDLAVSKSGHDRRWARAVSTAFADKAFGHEYARVLLGDASQFGSIVYEC